MKYRIRESHPGTFVVEYQQADEWFAVTGEIFTTVHGAKAAAQRHKNILDNRAQFNERKAKGLDVVQEFEL